MDRARDSELRSAWVHQSVPRSSRRTRPRRTAMRPVLVLSLLVVLAPRAYLGQEDDNPVTNEQEAISTTTSSNSEDAGPRSYTYDQAVQAYLEEDWDACLQAFRYLLHRFLSFFLLFARDILFF